MSFTSLDIHLEQGVSPSPVTASKVGYFQMAS